MGNTCASPRDTVARPHIDVSAVTKDMHTPHAEFNEAYAAGDRYSAATPNSMPQRWGADASTRQFDDRNVERIAAAMGI
jgi:hypothetical protein